MGWSRWMMRGAVPALALIACSASSETDELSTKGRLHLIKQPLGLTNGAAQGGIGTKTFSGSAGYTYLAAVDSPVNPETSTTVQATNFAFDDRYAYVVYNTKDEEVSGALDVVDLTNPEKPLLVSSVLFTKAEFADIRVVGGYAFLVGHRSDGPAKAAMVVADISDVQHPHAVTTLDLPGHAATSIAGDGTTAYVTTGDDGGLVTIDLKAPTAPSVTRFVSLPNAVNVVRNYQRTYVLGGSPGAVYTVDDGGALVPFADGFATGPLTAPSRMVVWNNALYTNVAAGNFVELPLDGGGKKQLASIEGTANGIDVGGDGVAVLAQGEKGTAIFDVRAEGSATALGSFAFPDERGSANEVRFGVINGSAYIFLSNGLTGFRIIRTNVTDGDPSSCTTTWWTSLDPSEWWALPASAAGNSTTGNWSPAADSTDKCLVEDFEPGLSNTSCTTTKLRRIRAIGPQPNEGQECPLSCPPGTVIANAHTRYGEASPLNAGGDYTCTGTTTPDLNEIPCDKMSDACNTGPQSTCTVRYHNDYCGDPWYYCIKNGRTKWTCVPQ